MSLASTSMVAETAVPAAAPLNRGHNVNSSSPAAYMIQVPPNTQPGEKFPVTIEGRKLMVTCPPDARPGTMVRVAANIKLTCHCPLESSAFIGRERRQPKCHE